MKTDFKKYDLLDRRQKERPLNLGIHDISCARYFTIGDSFARYSLTSQQFSDGYRVYSHDENGRELIGYAKPDRNKIIISVRKHGLDWASRIALSEIHIFGNKLPAE